jgi:hypothetical protein
VFSPPIGFSERIAAAVIRRRVAHIVPFVVVVLVSLSLKFFSLLDLWGKHTRRRVVVGRSCSFYSSSSLSLSLSLFATSVQESPLSLSLFSLSFLPLALFRGVGKTHRQKRLMTLCMVVFEREETF